MKPLTISLCVALSAGACLAWSQGPTRSQTPQQAPTVKIKMVPITRLPVDAGKEMYNSYCASCHGENGKGNGAAAPALSKVVPDLTLLASQNGGQYPKYKVPIALSKFSESHYAGTRSEMPDWYRSFVSLDSTCPFKADLRARNISKHIETLQVVR